MDQPGSPDYKELFLREIELRRQAEEVRKHAEEQQKFAEEHQKLAEEQQKLAEGQQKRAEERQKRSEEQQKRAEEQQKLAEGQQKRAEEQQKRSEEQQKRAEEQQKLAEEQNRQFTRKTSLLEYLQTCHNLLSRPLRVRTPSRSTQGKIPAPEGKFCPNRLLPWSDCAAAQQGIYDSVCNFLQATSEHPPQLFPTIDRLEGLADSLNTPLSSERDLESYERFAVEHHVRDIISKLCKIPEARRRFRLGDGVWFESHTNILEEDSDDAVSLDAPDRPRPDQFCIHRVDHKHSLLMTVEYKPPHKLTAENLRVGLQPTTDFWNDVVQRETIPTDEAEKLKYNAQQISASAITQEYHVMICEGLELSYVTTGRALVLLRVPQDDPGTLLYFVCEPNMEIDVENDTSYQEPRTAISRVLCLSLMSSLSSIRDYTWRNRAMAQLHTWATSLDLVRSQIPYAELRQTPPGSEYPGSPDNSSEGIGSSWLPSSSPPQSPTPQSRVQTRSSCAPSQATRHLAEDNSDSDSNQIAPGRKRNRSDLTSSSSVTQSPQSKSFRGGQGSQPRQQTMQFCTQKCLLGLRQGALLDTRCPNVDLHREDDGGQFHPITAEGLVQRLKQQLDKDLDHYCTPHGDSGSFGAPFKIVCARYGYTIIGKGTTDRLWKKVSGEKHIYSILRKAQGSSVPIFLGTIDLQMTLFLHGAGGIRHMLLMSWGGESIKTLEPSAELKHEIRRSKKEIGSLGVIHGDIRDENLLWNPELQRIFLIDFHDVTLKLRPKQQTASRKRKFSGSQTQEQKRLQV